MILKAVHEAHGTRPANVLVSGSGPRPVDPRGRIKDLFNEKLSTLDAYGAPALVLQGQQNRAG